MLKDQLQKDMISALKAGNKLDLSVLRFVISELKYAEIAKQADLSDDEVVQLLQKEIKKRKEAVEMFRSNKRDELATEEEKQIDVILKYVPQQLTITEVEKIVSEVMSQLGEKPQMGQIMGLVMSKTKGRVDGKVVADIVQKRLS